MSDIVFYQLNARFLERQEDIPAEAQQVVYYSLAIGHHLGVFDCFKPKLKCSGAVFDRVLDALPADSEARRKLDGIRRFGEIQVDKTHVALLQDAIDRASTDDDPEVADWLSGLAGALAAIRAEPVIYLMGRRTK